MDTLKASLLASCTKLGMTVIHDDGRCTTVDIRPDSVWRYTYRITLVKHGYDKELIDFSKFPAPDDDGWKMCYYTITEENEYYIVHLKLYSTKRPFSNASAHFNVDIGHSL